ncbi:MAG: Crp/Fnr family transcriptional regulator [Dehalococcoidia bacterium]|nr:Crp/Fnr family transcriptional regulator [Dehalococcoidia bacterium]
MAGGATAAEIRAIPYLSAMTEAEAEAFAAELPVRSYRPREFIVIAGEKAIGFYLLRAGKARIFRTGADGREQIFRLVTPGQTFAEVPIFDGGPNPATVEAIEACEVVFFPAERMQRLVLARPDIGLAVIRYMARRIRAFTDLVEQISLQTVQSRLARYLYQVAREEGLVTEEGTVIRRELTLQDLAALVGSVREVVSRTMRVLEEDGVVIVRRKEIVIRDVEELSRLL